MPRILQRRNTSHDIPSELHKPPQGLAELYVSPRVQPKFEPDSSRSTERILPPIDLLRLATEVLPPTLSGALSLFPFSVNLEGPAQVPLLLFKFLSGTFGVHSKRQQC